MSPFLIGYNRKKKTSKEIFYYFFPIISIIIIPKVSDAFNRCDVSVEKEIAWIAYPILESDTEKN